MTSKIKCYTLFDITRTGVLNRNKPSVDEDYNSWLYKRNTQCNFDTILQALSLRGLPEIVEFPSKNVRKLNDNKFGYVISKYDLEIPVWSFVFEIQNITVYDNGSSNMGYLYEDCNKVPIIKCGTEFEKLGDFLDISEEFRNIYFEVLENEE